jgi:DNA-binding NarL/FixJ family response regulator
VASGDDIRGDSLRRVARPIAAHETVTGRGAMSGGNRNLTPRELDVLACLIAGMRNREIATELNISMSTVKSHLSSMYEKLGVSTRIQAGLVGLGIFPMLLSTGQTIYKTGIAVPEGTDVNVC